MYGQQNVKINKTFLDFKLSPCSLCGMFSLGDSTSANPGSLCCITSRKTDSHQYNTVIPPAQHLFLPPPPSTTCCASTRNVRSGHSPPYWPCHFPDTTISGINTPHVPSLVILHPPALEAGTDGRFRNVSF